MLRDGNFSSESGRDSSWKTKGINPGCAEIDTELLCGD